MLLQRLRENLPRPFSSCIAQLPEDDGLCHRTP
jgi:hypothetical protein